MKQLLVFSQLNHIFHRKSDLNQSLISIGKLLWIRPVFTYVSMGNMVLKQSLFSIRKMLWVFWKNHFEIEPMFHRNFTLNHCLNQSYLLVGNFFSVKAYFPYEHYSESEHIFNMKISSDLCQSLLSIEKLIWIRVYFLLENCSQSEPWSIENYSPLEFISHRKITLHQKLFFAGIWIWTYPIFLTSIYHCIKKVTSYSFNITMILFYLSFWVQYCFSLRNVTHFLYEVVVSDTFPYNLLHQ